MRWDVYPVVFASDAECLCELPGAGAPCFFDGGAAAERHGFLTAHRFQCTHEHEACAVAFYQNIE